MAGTPTIARTSDTVITITFTAGAGNAGITSVELPDAVFASVDLGDEIMTFVSSGSTVSDDN